MSDHPEVQRALSMLTEATTILRRQSSGSGSGSNALSAGQGQARTTTPQVVPDRVAELRNLFQPYGSSGRNRPGPSSAARSARRPTPIPPRFWSNRFFCLNDAQSTHTPSVPIKMELQQNGFGLEIIQIEMNGDADAVRTAIESTFPKLQGKSFELLRALSGGENKPLVRLSNSNAIVPVAYLVSITRRGTVYIRPAETIPLDQQQITSDEELEVPHDSGSRVALDNVDHNEVIIENDISENTTTTEIGMAASNTNERAVGEFQTLDEFIGPKLRENEGSQPINIRREDFATEVIGVYTKGNINLFKEPQIFFVGEPGRDFGALRREYFHEGIKAITNGKYDNRYPIFDGEMDHKIPSTNAVLLRGNVFEAVGKFLVHSVLHTGIGGIGLSEALIEYLTMDSVTTNTAFTVNINDVTQYEIREALMALENWPAQNPDPDALRKVHDVASDCGYEDHITNENRIMISQHILYHHVIEKRKPQMEAMKKAFVESGLTKFLSDRPYLVSGVFPHHSELNIPTELIIQKICYRGEERNSHLADFLSEYIRGINPNGEKSKEILSAWTGWPLLPESCLVLKVDDDVDFIVHACTNEIVMPATWTAADLKRNMDLLLEYGCAGFGVI